MIPPFVTSILTSGYAARRRARRWGGVFEDHFTQFSDNLRRSVVELEDLQEGRFKAQIEYAFANVPYYRNVMRNLRLKPSDFRTLEDVSLLPIIDKNVLVENSSQFFAEGAPRRQFVQHRTGGSTGQPLTVYYSPELEQIHNAFVWSRVRRHVSRGQPSVSFTGRNLRLGVARKTHPLWIENWTDRQRLLSISHISKDTLEVYQRGLTERNFEFATGYPSAWGLIADFLLDNQDLDRPEIPYFYSSSEVLTTERRTAITHAFGSKIYDHYGQAELVAAITEYDCGHLHYDMDYSLVDFQPIEEHGDCILAKIIGTQLYPSDWPLIRYDTGDLVLYDPNETCSKIASPVIRQIFGRCGTFLQLPSGRKITNISTLSRHCSNVRQIQAIQRLDESIEIHVVGNRSFNADDKKLTQDLFESAFECSVTVKCVDSIRQTKTGKTPLIVRESEKGPIRD